MLILPMRRDSPFEQLSQLGAESQQWYPREHQTCRRPRMGESIGSVGEGLVARYRHLDQAMPRRAGFARPETSTSVCIEEGPGVIS